MSQGLCPSCGAAANLTAEQNEANCTYCGSVMTRQAAEAQFGAVNGSKIGGALMLAQTAQEGGNYAEAIAYWNKIIEQESTCAEAWLNKGLCVYHANNTLTGDFKIGEATASWKAAIKCAANPEAMKKRVARISNNIRVNLSARIESLYEKSWHEENAMSVYLQRCLLYTSPSPRD